MEDCDDFEVIDFLGYGAFSSVDLVRYLEDDNLYALKTMSKNSI